MYKEIDYLADGKGPVPLSKVAFGNALLALGEENEDIVVCEADLMRVSGTKGFSEKFPERHFNFGVAEQNCMAAAAGLALSGKTVFATTFANFASKRAADQVSIAIAYNKANVKVCGTYAGLTSEKNGGTHIGVEDLAIMRATPNMRVVEPADPVELAEITRVIADYEGPVYFRLPKLFYRNIFNEKYRFKFGEGTEVFPGDDITLIACGIMTGIAIQAAEELKEQGFSVRVINMSSIKPIDEAIILKAAKETKAIFTLENHSVVGGLGSAVAEVLSENRISLYFERLGIRDQFGETASLDWQLDKNGISKEKIADLVKNKSINI